MYMFFKICFFTGAILAFTMFLFGGVLDIANIDGFDVDFDIPTLSFLPLKPNLIILFITLLGGIGIILHKLNLNSIMVLLISIVVSFLITTIFYNFVLKPLYKAQNTSTVSQKDLIGKQVSIKIPIRENKVGQIVYTVNGVKYTAPAKSIDNQEVENGEKVIIIAIENNIFYVKK